jgi:beta-galactosidase
MKKVSGRTVFLIVVLSLAAGAGISGVPAGASAGNRWSEELVKWKFHRGDRQGASDVSYDDEKWETVYLPHTMALEPRLYEKKETYFRGVGWYRTGFSLDPEKPFGDLRLEFDAAMARADVWLNGEHLGRHLGGYTPFAFDITDRAYLDRPNLLAVKVDNRTMEVPPDGFTAATDYTLNGGLYRKVRLVGRNDVFVEDVYITTPEVSASHATIKSVISVRNRGDDSALVSALSEVFNPGGRSLIQQTRSDEKTVAAGAGLEITVTGIIENPRRWSPDHPHLYTVKTSVLNQGGARLDSVSARIGIRTIEFTPDRGLLLNGEPIELIGPNRHQTYPYLGNAVPDRYQRWDAQLIKDAGFNFVRCSHYPQSPAFLDACDELGVMVYEELPGWNYIGDEEWKDLAAQAVEEMILRDRNRPSIVIRPGPPPAPGSWAATITFSRT